MKLTKHSEINRREAFMTQQECQVMINKILILTLKDSIALVKCLKLRGVNKTKKAWLTKLTSKSWKSMKSSSALMKKWPPKMQAALQAKPVEPTFQKD